MLKFRYLAVVAVAILLVHALGLLGLAIYRTYEAYRAVFQGGAEAGNIRPGIPIAESVDAALFALVLIVLALGTVSLYLTPGVSDPRIPAWMCVRSLSELKTLLWEAILLVLVMAALTSIMANTDHLGWDLLILPVAVLILAAGLFLKAHTSE
ncbi:MAG TPA: YqhA family protein [Candidatus Eisenbacteria bacterium]|nr:YqhA family protein [Candidatus Eisenbacteria bacterium]